MMKINDKEMATPIGEKVEIATLQKMETVQAVSPTAALSGSQLNQPAFESKERTVQITSKKNGVISLSIRGGKEYGYGLNNSLHLMYSRVFIIIFLWHRLPILISRMLDKAADQNGQLFVGDGILKVNGENLTACNHADAVNIVRNAGDNVVLTVKHYRDTPFSQVWLDV